MKRIPLRKFLSVSFLLFSCATYQSQPPHPTQAFQKIILNDQYLCDGINFGDFNKDTIPDIVAGPYWYEGPIFTIKHEFYPAVLFPLPPSPTNSLYDYIYDFNHDGWQDILVLGRVHLHSAYWYENPKGRDVHWKKHYVFERIKGESPPFVDITGDGKPELIAHWEGQWGWIAPDWNTPEEPWQFHPITRTAEWNQFYHGTGVGDVNSDGRMDLILNDGWWEHPMKIDDEWIEHPYRFDEKRGGAQMFAYDVDGDNDNDIITSLNSHGYGLAWFENIKEHGAITFRMHKIMGDRSEEERYGVCFTQPHALDLADINGDGLLDIITGKRIWAHGPMGDIEPNAPPVLYWFELRRGKYGAAYIPHLIDNHSGVGVQVIAVDVTGDTKLDILTVSKLGAFLFVNN